MPIQNTQYKKITTQTTFMYLQMEQKTKIKLDTLPY